MVNQVLTLISFAEHRLLVSYYMSVGSLLENLIWFHAKDKGADHPAHPHSLIRPSKKHTTCNM